MRHLSAGKSVITDFHGFESLSVETRTHSKNRDLFDMCSDLAVTAVGAKFSSSYSTFVLRGAQVPDALAPPRAGRLLLDGSDIVGWLRRLKDVRSPAQTRGRSGHGLFGSYFLQA